VHLHALTSALADHFGPGSDVESPEDESEAWRVIVQEHRRGGYPHLLRELDALLAGSDGEVERFLASHAPAWSVESAEEARHSLEVFYSYGRPIATKRPNYAMEQTADRRENSLSMTSTLKLNAQLALVSGRSALSR
jgi:hypothetical protein